MVKNIMNSPKFGVSSSVQENEASSPNGQQETKKQVHFSFNIPKDSTSS